MRKKALSTVVVTVLIILVAIIAVTIMWAVIKPLIEKGAKGAGQAQECIALDLSLEKAVYNNATGELNITVKRNVGEATLKKIKFLVDGIDMEPIETVWPLELETKPYTIEKTENIETKPEKIEIAGVVSEDKLCGVADTIKGSEIEPVV